MKSSYFNCHTHTMYSNLRILDSTNRPEDVINKAIELGLSGLAITDHECLSSHVIINKIAKKLREDGSDFKIALGNEIYLVNERKNGQKYYHFLLMAKDAYGYKGLKELSSIAWYNSYTDRKLERVPLLKSELKEIGSKYKGHIIATTACRGGELSTLALEKYKLDQMGQNSQEIAQKMLEFTQFCREVFGEDFYIECAPSTDKEQIAINRTLLRFAQVVGLKLTVGTDAHYLTPTERPIHKAYLNSKEGDREVDSFYQFTYLMSANEIYELLGYSFSESEIDNILNTSIEIQDKIEFYDLFNKQSIMEIKVKDYPKQKGLEKYPVLHSMLESDNIQERYWVNQCIESLDKKELNNDIYLSRLEEEADTKRTIGEKLNTCMFAYPNTLQHYIDLFWQCGSIVGAGRGSSCSGLNHYLLGITQLDPIKWNLPWFRYMNKERVEIGDIDLDLCPSKRPFIIEKIKQERENSFNVDVAPWAKKNLGITLIATFGTEKTKSAILAACRGYRSKDCPDGIDVDEAQYLSSLVPEERGFLWPIHDVLFGNQEKGRKPVQTFIRAAENYPGLIEIIQSIEGLVNKRSSHASGVVFFEGDPFEKCAFMKTPKGEIISQYDLHDLEYLGNTKYDFLVTDVQDKLATTIQLLQKDNQIESNLSLREVYEKYFHPEVLPIEDKKIWEALENGEVINVFQFDSLVGIQAAKRIKPKNVLELMDANGLMRLMGEDGEERPIDKYIRFKNNISLWYEEMTKFGLTKEEQKTLEPYFLESFGVPPSQEQLMLMLMDKDICNFTLAESNAARKIVGKKLMDKIPQLREKIFAQAKSPLLGEYVWKHGVGPQMGYSFSKIHALVYSFIGAQTLYIATHWDPIYWDTGCLIVNSGSLEDNSEEELVDIFEQESDDIQDGIIFEDLPDKSAKIRKTTSTDYGKMAKAIGEIRDAGIKISLVDINKSNFSFSPDVENQQILFGFKGMLGIGDDFVTEIINNRPYISPRDFLNRVKPKKGAMIALIKGGAFDSMIDRKLCMGWYLWETCDKKNNLNLQNMPTLIKYNLIPQNTEEEKIALRVYEFNRYLKAITKASGKILKDKYILDTRAIDFIQEIEQDSLIDDMTINSKAWDKVYQKYMDIFRDWLKSNMKDILDKLNGIIFKEAWSKYAQGSISAWEMNILCFYYHEHELTNVDFKKYNIMDYTTLPKEPIIERTFYKGNHQINIYKLSLICGTCIAKNKTKSTITLLTPHGVVTVKFSKEHFTYYDRQLSERLPDGKKKVVEKSWFSRGSMLIVQGIKRDDSFIPKKYANGSGGHRLYKITEVLPDGELVLQTERYQGE